MDDEETSSEIRPVMTPTIHDSHPSPTNGKMCLVNGRPGVVRESTEQTKPTLYADPWIRRCDQPSSIDSISNQDQQRQKSIQYETRLYYHSLSSTSDDHLSQQQQQPLLSNVDKDIEYVESRLRGQTTISLPNTHDVSWRQLPNHNYINTLLSTSNDQQQQTRLVHQKYPTTTNTQQINEKVLSPPKSIPQKVSTPLSTNTNGSVKTVKSRGEKMKDQKAAKTLR
jgi:hypothetical protein